jgi:hypothetical protein
MPIAELVQGRIEEALERRRHAYDFAGFASVIRERAGLRETRLAAS